MMKIFTIHIFDPEPRYGGWFDSYVKIFAEDIQSAWAEAEKEWRPTIRLVEI